MADSQDPKTLTLSEQYALKGKDEKVDVEAKPVEVKEVETPATIEPEEVVATEKAEEQPAAAESTEKAEEQPAPAESTEKAEEQPAAAESSENASATTVEESPEADPPAAEETSDNAEDPPAEVEVQEEKKPERKFQTAPPDYRFPTTNQTRHCFTRYIEFHRCVAAKGEEAPECEKFQRYYRALCPNDWIERWDEQREEGTFPGPL